MYIRFLVILFALICITGATSADVVLAETDRDSLVIRKISFSGEFKLRSSIIRREIQSHPGIIYDSLRLDNDRKRIDSFRLFSRVDTRIQIEGDSVDIDFELKEFWTLRPLVSVGRSDNSFDWMVGLRERDLFGHFISTLLYYRRFEGENSYGFSISFPRPFGSRFSVGLGASENKEEDLILFDDEITAYRYMVRVVSGSIGYMVNDHLWLRFYGGYDRENWTIKPEENLPEGAQQFYDFPRYTVGAAVDFGRVLSDHYFYQGVNLSTSFTLVDEQTSGPFNSWRASVSSRAYLIESGVNFALRARYSTSSADERVPPYAISGSSNVRGYLDRTERGDHFLGGNAEIRLRGFESKLLYTQLVAFTDVGSVWGRNRSASDALGDPYYSVGFGLRAAIKRFFGNIGRLDLALNPKTGNWSYYISAYQFF